MNTIRTNSPNFGMKLKGLDNPYFKNVSKSLIQEVKTKAERQPNTDYTIEFIPAKDNFVFLRKLFNGQNYLVEYFPKGYTPEEVVKTFLKAMLPEYRVMGKMLRQETNKLNTERVYRQLYN